MERDANNTDGFTKPPQDPPPYPGPPNPGSSYPGSGYPGATYTNPITNQPQGIPLQEPLVPGAVPGATIIITQSMGTQPAVTVCRSCGIQITTRVEQMPSMRTHLFALLLCLIGFWPCACVPYCIDTCNNADHYCPNCNAFIGSYHGV